MEDELEMGLFDSSNMKLNFNFDDDDTPDENIIDDDEESTDEPIIDAVEEDIPEDVDSDDVDEDSDSDDDDKSSSNIYSSLTKVIHEQGLLPSLDINTAKIENVDDFVNAMKVEQDAQVQIKLDEYISNLDVNQLAQSRQVINDLNNLDQDVLSQNIDLAKQLIMDDYANQGLDEKKIARHLKRLTDLGEEAILEDAIDSLESLKEFEGRRIENQKLEYAKNLEADKARQVQLDADLKRNIYERTDLINGLKPTKALQDKVYDSINKIVGKSPEGEFENKFMRERRINPVEFETKMYFLYEMTDGFTNYSKLSSGAKSSAVNDLEKAARKTSIKDNGTPTWMQDSQSYSGFGSGKILNI